MNLPRLYRTAAACVLAFLLAGPASAQPVVEAAREDVAVLASPEMKGRGYTLGGHDRAAEYIRRHFAEIGLRPPEGGYYQRFPLEADLFPRRPVLQVDGRDLVLGEDFLPYPGSGSGRIRGGRVVRAGYGLHLPEHGLDSFAGKRIAGAVVVLRTGLPEHVQDDPAITPAETSTAARIEAAAQRGAAAVILLVDGLMFRSTGYDARIPVLEVRAAAWPEAAERARVRVAALPNQALTSQNVIGVLPGTLYPDSTILLTAHYDHHGAVGESFFFPGANDNASGVAMLLSLARYFADHPPAYTLVFIAFSGEEVGLFGSRYFAEHPVVDLEKAKFLLNFDMVASGEKGVVAVGGVDFPEAFRLLERVNAELGEVPLGRRKNVPNSDQYFLIERGVPGFFLYTSGGSQPYHHAEDVPATLEWDDFQHVYDLARGFIEAL